jgi:hypothetical protein
MVCDDINITLLRKSITVGKGVCQNLRYVIFGQLLK